MSILYILLAPLWFLTLNKRIRQIISSVEEGNRDKLKADGFFLGLVLAVTIQVVLAIEW